MEKRLFNKLGFETSLLGLGCMRFPQKNGKIDLLETEKLVDACMAGGINYFDTAYVYGDGDSENAVKRTLVERYPRERFYLANKLPMWLIPEGHTPQELLETSLKRTGVTYFDQYLLHNLNQENWEICKKENLVDFIFAKKAAGAVRNAGFSFHDTPEVLHEILDAADWDFVQLQINYYDWETAQRAKEQYEMVEGPRHSLHHHGARARRLARFAASRRGLSAYRCRPKGKPGLMGAPVCREPSQYGSRTQRYVRHGAGNRKSPALWPVSAAQHSGNRAAPAGGIHFGKPAADPLHRLQLLQGLPEGRADFKRF